MGARIGARMMVTGRLSSTMPETKTIAIEVKSTA